MQPSETDAQHLGTLWMGEFDEPLPAHPIPRLSANFVHVDPQMAQELAQALSDDRTNVAERFALRRRCYAARVEGKLASYGWVTFDEERIGELGLSIRLQAGEAYIWGCATLPAYRGQHLYPALLAYMLRALESEGVRRVWIGADADNLASQSGLVLVGFRPVADVVLTKRTMWVRGCPGVPEHLVTDARHALFGEQLTVELDGPFPSTDVKASR